VNKLRSRLAEEGRLDFKAIDEKPVYFSS